MTTLYSILCDNEVCYKGNALIICDGKVLTDLEQSFIGCPYKDKSDALDRGNYPGLTLTEQAMKILVRIVDGLTRQVST